MAWHRLVEAKPLSEPMMVRLLTHICVTRPQLINSHNTASYSMETCYVQTRMIIIIPPASAKLKGGILVSPCPSVRLWTESCPLRIFNNTHRIHFIFAHLIKQLQKVCNAHFKIKKFYSMVWVIMRRRGVSSECRCSSCSCYHWNGKIITLTNLLSQAALEVMTNFSDVIVKLPQCEWNNLEEYG